MPPPRLRNTADKGKMRPPIWPEEPADPGKRDRPTTGKRRHATPFYPIPFHNIPSHHITSHLTTPTASCPTLFFCRTPHAAHRTPFHPRRPATHSPTPALSCQYLFFAMSPIAFCGPIPLPRRGHTPSRHHAIKRDAINEARAKSQSEKNSYFCAKSRPDAAGPSRAAADRRPQRAAARLRNKPPQTARNRNTS